MYHARSALLLVSTIVCGACADNRTQEPATPSDVDLTVAQNGAAATQSEQELTRGKVAVTNPELPTAQHQATATATGKQTAKQSAAQQQAPLRPGVEVRPENEEQARAAFTSANGYELHGQAEFTEVARGVEVRVAVNGAPPGVKGVHIHQKADCSDIPNKSMGGHFSPDKNDHGFPTSTEHHLGDLGNIQIGADGAGELKVVVPAANLKDADTHSFLTRSIVVHETSDTAMGQSGAAGNPIACGIIDR